MIDNYLNILESFLDNSKAKRIIYELSSSKKRNDAFSKLTNFDVSFKGTLRRIELTHLRDSEAITEIRKITKIKECFNLKKNQIEDLESAYIDSVNSYMCNVLVVDVNTVIYIGECYFGASDKYILLLK